MKKILMALIVLCAVAHRAQAQNNIFPLTTKMWKTNTITVCWDNPDVSNATERKWVQEAIAETWEKNSAVKFTRWEASSLSFDGEVHILIRDATPTTIMLGNQFQHVKNAVTLNFSFQVWPGCKQSQREFCIKAMAVHEFGHVLGFAHELNKRECAYDNCMREPQGEDGDWHMNQCDQNSIMNYCSPVWNDGLIKPIRDLLSPDDITALQHFYHKPGNQSSLFRGIELVYNTAITNRKNLGTRKINHQVNAFVVGDPENMQKIEKVVYFLDDETFHNPVVTVRSAANSFGLGLRVWGEFTLVAIVFYKTGDMEVRKRFLKFEDNETALMGRKVQD